LPLIPEVARELVKARPHLKDLRSLPPDGFAAFCEEILVQKEALAVSHPNFVADRGTVDPAALWLHWIGRDVPEERTRQYVQRCRAWMGRCTHVFLLPWGSIRLEADGYRSPQGWYQYEVHCLIRGLLAEWDIPYHTVRSAGAGERVLEATALMEGY
jgi:hypothetical protein